jgi:hypothetical protein
VDGPDAVGGLKEGSRSVGQVLEYWERGVKCRRRGSQYYKTCEELKGFQKIFLKPGESKKVKFVLSPDQPGFYNENLEFVVERVVRCRTGCLSRKSVGQSEDQFGQSEQARRPLSALARVNVLSNKK